MRKYFILLILTIFLAGVSVYFVTSVYPYNKEAIEQLIVADNIKLEAELTETMRWLWSQGLVWDYINWRAILPGMISIAAALFTGFAWFHLIIDKLFFQFAYDPPNLIAALRRSAVVVLAVYGALFLRVFKAEWYLYLALWGLLVAVEVIITQKFHKQAISSGPSIMRMALNKVLSVKGYFSQAWRQAREATQIEESAESVEVEIEPSEPEVTIQPPAEERDT